MKLPRQDSLSESSVAALGRELTNVSMLDHPSIPRLLGHDMTADVPYIVYEFVEGLNLSESLEQDGPCGWIDAAYLGMELAAALRHLHEREIVHLDLKPRNVIMRDGRAVLIDFDIALPVATVRSETKPRGTHQYMAPEQIRCQPAHPLMDMFALGTVLYETVTGQRTFRRRRSDCSSQSTSTATADKVYRQLDQDPTPLAELVPDISDGFAAFVHSLLDRDPSRRPQSATHVLASLRELLPPDEEGLWPSWADPMQGL
ncbi:MAG: serine/threonine-protein kinase [Acidimicrobiales bacterium]